MFKIYCNNYNHSVAYVNEIDIESIVDSSPNSLGTHRVVIRMKGSSHESFVVLMTAEQLDCLLRTVACVHDPSFINTSITEIGIKDIREGV